VKLELVELYFDQTYRSRYNSAVCLLERGIIYKPRNINIITSWSKYTEVLAVLSYFITMKIRFFNILNQ